MVSMSGGQITNLTSLIQGQQSQLVSHVLQRGSKLILARLAKPPLDWGDTISVTVINNLVTNGFVLLS